VNDEERESLEELAAEASKLRAAVHDLQERISFNRRWNQILTGLIALKAATIVVLIVVVVNLSHTNSRIQESLHLNYVTAQQQAQTRSQVLCPLYGLFLGAVETPSQPVETEQQRQQLAKDLKIIQDGYRSLGCQPALP
jgi:hypothetical protein